MTAKEIVAYFKKTFALGSVNYPLQMQLAKKLLDKYSGNEIKYAIDYYKEKGQNCYSLGWLLWQGNMNYPVSLYRAEINKADGEQSGERNKQRIEQHSQAKHRESAVSYLFEEPDEDN